MTALAGQVRQRFARSAATYDSQARLQRSLAWRLAHQAQALPLPPGPRADLGAGSGLLSRALLQHNPSWGQQPPLQLDLCPELLAANPLTQAPPQAAASGTPAGPIAVPASAAAPALAWDLNRGLPPQLQGAALLASSFALQWLEQPAQALGVWAQALAPGGWLLLAVPTAGSFPQWRQAAAQAGVPCTALALPPAPGLLAAVEQAGLRLQQRQLLRFTLPRHGGLVTLRWLRNIGAGASQHRPLAPAQLRRLLAHWPPATPLSWEVLLLIAQAPTPPPRHQP